LPVEASNCVSREDSVNEYDEPKLVRRLSQVSLKGQAAFAAACAERTFPLYERYAALTGQGNQAQLRAALDAAWKAVGTEVSREDLARWRKVAGALVPDDEDPGWIDETAYGQNGAAAIAYTLSTHLTGNPQDAGWAARQLYEAADYAAQRQLGDLDINDPRAEDALRATLVVQEALFGIQEVLAFVNDKSEVTCQDAVRLKRQAYDAGERLAKFTLRSS